jgi:hypothetical protein
MSPLLLEFYTLFLLFSILARTKPFYDTNWGVAYGFGGYFEETLKKLSRFFSFDFMDLVYCRLAPLPGMGLEAGRGRVAAR